MGFLDRLFGKPNRKDVNDPEWQVPAVQAICIAMIRQIPEEWDSAYLVLEPGESGFGNGLAHSAISRKRPDGMALQDGSFVTPNADVMEATRAFELGWVQRKCVFRKAIISASREGEDWEVKSEYEHD